MADEKDDKKNKQQKQQQKDVAFEPGAVLQVAKQFIGDMAEHLPEQHEFKRLEQVQAIMDSAFGEQLGRNITTASVGVLMQGLRIALEGTNIPHGITWTVLETLEEFFDGVRRHHREKGRLTQQDLTRIYDQNLDQFKKRVEEEKSFVQMAQMLTLEKQEQLRNKINAFIDGDETRSKKFDWWKRKIKNPRMLDSLLQVDTGDWDSHLTQILGEPSVKKPTSVVNTKVTQVTNEIRGFIRRNGRSLLGLADETNEVSELRGKIAAYNTRLAGNVTTSRERGNRLSNLFKRG
jgi:hypothetical protein